VRDGHNIDVCKDPWTLEIEVNLGWKYFRQSLSYQLIGKTREADLTGKIIGCGRSCGIPNFTKGSGLIDGRVERDKLV
jgi:hypothetical protein